MLSIIRSGSDIAHKLMQYDTLLVCILSKPFRFKCLLGQVPVCYLFMSKYNIKSTSVNLLYVNRKYYEISVKQLKFSHND